MAQVVSDRKLREIDSEISQLQRQLELHQGRADGLRRQISKLSDRRKALAKRRRCLHRKLDQKFIEGNLVFVCSSCGQPVLDVPSSERDPMEEAQNRCKALH